MGWFAGGVVVFGTKGGFLKEFLLGFGNFDGFSIDIWRCNFIGDQCGLNNSFYFL